MCLSGICECGGSGGGGAGAGRRYYEPAYYLTAMLPTYGANNVHK